MATKRMFSKDITGSDAFLDMPASTQVLYFHLGMEADDDGFVGNPKKVMRVIGSSEDDLKILLTKRFLLTFTSGVVVVKHHRINNNWDKYNCKRTMYLEEFSQLNIKENRSYTLDKSQGIPLQSANSLQAVSRIEEKRIDKWSGANAPQYEILPDNTETQKTSPKPKYPHSKEVFSWFPKPEKSWARNTTELEHAEFLWERGEATVKKVLAYYERHKDDEGFGFVVTSPSHLERKWASIAEYARRTQ